MNAPSPPEEYQPSSIALSHEIDRCIIPTLNGPCPAIAITTATQALFMSLIPIAAHALATVLEREGDPEKLLTAMEADCKFMVQAAIHALKWQLTPEGREPLQ